MAPSVIDTVAAGYVGQPGVFVEIDDGSLGIRA
jgi:hypothetical protein